MKIYLDIQNTLFELNDRCNFGWVEVIKKLQDSGKHKIILNTSFKGIELDKYLQRINEDSWMFSRDKDMEIQPILDVVSEKIYPSKWDWKQMVENDIMFIDDSALCIDLRTDFEGFVSIVNWDKLDKQFEENNMY